MCACVRVCACVCVFTHRILCAISSLGQSVVAMATRPANRCGTKRAHSSAAQVGCIVNALSRPLRLVVALSLPACAAHSLPVLVLHRARTAAADTYELRQCTDRACASCFPGLQAVSSRLYSTVHWRADSALPQTYRSAARGMARLAAFRGKHTRQAHMVCT